MVPRPAGDLRVVSLAAADQVGKKLDGRCLGHGLEFRGDGSEGAFLHGNVAVGAVLGAEFGKEESQKLVDLCDGGHGRLASASRDSLLDGDARREALDPVDIRFLKLLDELPGVGRHAVEEASLPLGEKDIERQSRLAAAA